jgi:thioredoxin reductase (NADPH)
MITGSVENFPGFSQGIDGQRLMADMRAQAERFAARFVTEDVETVDLSKHPFTVTSMSGEKQETLALIIATGATARRLPLDSEKKLWGRGISACAVCDGALPVFRNKPLAVIGGGDSAIEEAMHLTKFGSKVYIIHRRDAFRASKVMQKRATENPKIEILWTKTVEEFLGDKMLAGLKLKDTRSGQVSSIEVNGAFEAIGHTPNSAFLNSQLKTDPTGYILTQPGTTKTSVEGVFAAGDVQDPNYRQAITAAASGCMAALDAERWLQEKGL